MDVVIAVLLDLHQQNDLRGSLGSKCLQERTVLLWRRERHGVRVQEGETLDDLRCSLGGKHLQERTNAVVERGPISFHVSNL